ncbi:Gfo/Idh/MocA family protein [Litorisediminicola beolgyonensis]|uniref:Gfo/Idh/MocA family protein n=1 Tax=Litorisediminicola beolgyonensis TaxID=1173614 RepID=A0ABW3ZE92_9RHOB
MADHCRLGIAGLGLVGRRHADAIAACNGARLVAVADPSADGQASADALGVRCFPSLDEMLDEAALDGVLLASPTGLHVDQAQAAVARGCPALIEKPIGTSAADAMALVEAAEAAGVPLLVGHHRRHNPLSCAAKEVIAEGRLGIIRAVQATCWFYKPDSYFDTAPWRKEPGAGPISVNLVHDVDLMRHFCGEVVAVQATASPSMRGFANEDVAAAVLEFESGAVGTISVSDSTVSPWSWEMTSGEYPVYPVTPESCYHIGGTDGALSIPDMRLWTHRGAPDWWMPISATSLVRGASDPLVNQIRHFVEVVLGREEPLVSGLEGVRTLQVVEGIQVSAQRRERVSIPRLGRG